MPSFQLIEELAGVLVGHKEMYCARLLILKSYCYQAKYQYSKAFLLVEESQKIAQKHRHFIVEAKAVHEMGYLSFLQNDVARAIDYFVRCLAFWEGTPYHKQLARAYNNVGAAYEKAKMMDKALENFLRALELHRKTGSLPSEANVLNNIGNVYLNMGLPLEAEEYLFRSLEISREIGNESGIVASLNYLATAKDTTGNAKEAMAYLLEALKMAEKDSSNSRKIAEILANLGNAYFSVGDFDTASEYYGRALSEADRSNHTGKKAVVLAGLAAIAKHHKNYTEAEELSYNALQCLSEAPNNYVLAEIYKLRAIIYEEQEKYKEALEMERLSFKYTLEYENEIQKDKVEYLRIKHSRDEVHYEKQRLHDGLQVREHELERTKQLLTEKSLECIFLENELKEAYNQITQIKSAASASVKSDVASLAGKLRSTLFTVRNKRGNEAALALDPDFAQRILLQYPTLSPVELRVCSLLRHKSTSKEIAELLAVSLRAIETYRYRIRKKLNLPAGVNLVTELAKM